MDILSLILSDLQAAIAAKAARDRSLTVLLVAVWARIARMRTRLERLVALWRAGNLPKSRASRAGRVGAPRGTPRLKFPTGPAWLASRVWAARPFGTQLAHYLSEEECVAFLAAVPQAGRILRPLLHMLGVEELPQVVRKLLHAAPVPAPVAEMKSLVVSPVSQFLSA